MFCILFCSLALRWLAVAAARAGGQAGRPGGVAGRLRPGGRAGWQAAGCGQACGQVVRLASCSGRPVLYKDLIFLHASTFEGKDALNTEMHANNNYSLACALVFAVKGVPCSMRFTIVWTFAELRRPVVLGV